MIEFECLECGVAVARPHRFGCGRRTLGKQQVMLMDCKPPQGVNEEEGDTAMRGRKSNKAVANHWAEDKRYSVADWQNDVANDDTRQSYKNWVETKRDIVEEECEACGARGFILAVVYENSEQLEIQRCDSCRRLASDSEAAKLAFSLAKVGFVTGAAPMFYEELEHERD